MTICFNRTLLAALALTVAAVPVWAQSGPTPSNTVVAPASVQETTHSRSVRHPAKISPTDGPQNIAGPVRSVGPLAAGPTRSEGPSKSVGPVWTMGPYKSTGPDMGAGPL